MIKMVPVDSNQIESVGYVVNGRKLFIKFQRGTVLCFTGVPGFRYDGLRAAPRPDAYFQTFIENKHLTKEVVFAPPMP
jgi:hypothetical protein